MKCLIVKQPWIDMELDGLKPWELRSRPFKYQGVIGLIEQGTGLIVGEAYLTGCIEFFDVDYLARFYDQHRVRDVALLKKWNVALVLDNIKRYEKPIPYTHPPGAVTWVNVDIHHSDAQGADIKEHLLNQDVNSKKVSIGSPVPGLENFAWTEEEEKKLNSALQSIIEKEAASNSDALNNNKSLLP